ncbi:MAG: hypothetical protein ABW110_18460 [Steroidobacteraceae bacterium]
MRLLKMGLLSALMILASPVAPATDAETHSPACKAAAGLEFICGLKNAEDLVRIPNTNWVITSSMGEPSDSRKLFLIDVTKRTTAELYPGSKPQVKLDKKTFSSCPGAPDLKNLTTHGLAIQRRAEKLHRLFVTTHGAREAVEVFDVAVGESLPSITWVGCVPMPPMTFINSVAPLPSGGFVVTKMMDSPTDRASFKQLVAGKVTGFVYAWHPGTGLVRLRGTDLSGPNGIETSADGKQIYVSSWGTSEVVRFARDSGYFSEKGRVKLPMRPDNLRWTDEGRLLATGQVLAAPDVDCGSMACFAGWAVVDVDFANMQTQTLLDGDANASFSGATVALSLPTQLLIGTFHGDRIAVAPRR